MLLDTLRYAFRIAKPYKYWYSSPILVTFGKARNFSTSGFTKQDEKRFVYVSDLPTESFRLIELKQKAEQYGPLVRISMPHGAEGKFLGFANVEFVKVEDAALFVQSSRQDPLYFSPKPSTLLLQKHARDTPLKIGRVGSWRVLYKNPTSLFVANLPSDCKESEIHEVFAKFGQIRQINIGSATKGSSAPWANVAFSSREEAITALEAHMESAIVIRNHDLTVDLTLKERPESGCCLFFRFFRGSEEEFHRKIQQYNPQQVKFLNNADGSLSGYIRFPTNMLATSAFKLMCRRTDFRVVFAKSLSFDELASYKTLEKRRLHAMKPYLSNRSSRPPRSVINIYTDASIKGAGGIFGSNWFSIPIPECWSGNQSHISFKEFFAVLYAAYCWGPELQGSHVWFNTDNLNVYSTIRNLTIHPAPTMQLYRQLLGLASQYNFTFDSQLIASGENKLADAASHLIHTELLSLGPHLDPVPSHKPKIIDMITTSLQEADLTVTWF